MTVTIKLVILLVLAVNEAHTQKSKVKFFLYTRRNKNAAQELFLNDLDSVYRSNFDANKPTIFLIHGWLSDHHSYFRKEVSSESLIKMDANIIGVDWSSAAINLNYLASANSVPDVGRTLANFINFFNENELIDLSETTIVGFSLGAHIGGVAGKNVDDGKIKTIIGLDPPGPAFNNKKPAERLHFTDADYVEVIHTNMGLSGTSKYIGHTDLIANNGFNQPGCFIFGSCSHDRAIDIYIESINKGKFWARKCNTTAKINQVNCRGQYMVLGDPENVMKNLVGVFHFTTNKRSPFAKPKPNKN